MKRKHYDIWGLVIILISIGAIAVQFSRDLCKESRGNFMFMFKPLAPVTIPDPETISEMERLGGKMDQLSRPMASNKAPVDLGLFGYRPIGRSRYTKAGKKPLLPPGMHYSLTLAFSGGTKRFCVIGGQFYEEGASLPDGARIVKIRPNRVLVRKQRFTSWVPVARKVEAKGNHQNKSGEKM